MLRGTDQQKLRVRERVRSEAGLIEPDHQWQVMLPCLQNKIRAPPQQTNKAEEREMKRTLLGKVKI